MTFSKTVESCCGLIDAISKIDSYQNVYETCKQMRSDLDHTVAVHQGWSCNSNKTQSGVPIDDEIYMLSKNADADLAQLSDSWLFEWLAQELFESGPSSHTTAPFDFHLYQPISAMEGHVLDSIIYQ